MVILWEERLKVGGEWLTANWGLEIASAKVCGGLLWSKVCLCCFSERAFEISEAERLHDLDKNSMGSRGVGGSGMAGKDGTILSCSCSSTPSSDSNPCQDSFFQGGNKLPSIFDSITIWQILNALVTSNRYVYSIQFCPIPITLSNRIQEAEKKG